MFIVAMASQFPLTLFNFIFNNDYENFIKRIRCGQFTVFVKNGFHTEIHSFPCKYCYENKSMEWILSSIIRYKIDNIRSYSLSCRSEKADRRTYSISWKFQNLFISDPYKDSGILRVLQLVFLFISKPFIPNVCHFMAFYREDLLCIISFRNFGRWSHCLHTHRHHTTRTSLINIRLNICDHQQHHHHQIYARQLIHIGNGILIHACMCQHTDTELKLRK